MKLLSISCVSFVLLLLTPRPSAPVVEPLKDLQQVRLIVEDLGKTEEDAGLSKEELESQALVAFRRDLPRLRINKAANSWVYVNILAVHAGSGFAVNLRIEVNRPVKILQDWSESEIAETTAPVWDDAKILAGPKYDMASRIHESINDMTTKLAADFYRQNPQ
jgi:hypothetical protein